MNCAEMSDLIDACTGGDLSEEAQARVDGHLQVCADCAAAMQALKRTRLLLRESYGRTESSPAYRERMAARLHDAFSDVLRPASEDAPSQRTLPFLFVQPIERR